MIAFRVHSHNVRGSIKSTANWIAESMEENSCECTAILLQDVGATGPDGPILLKNRLRREGHFICANSSSLNKSKSVVIVVHKSWNVEKVYREPSGSLVGVVISKNGFQVLLVSAYLPTNLAICGAP